MAAGGSPGASDSIGFSGDPDADLDNDGIIAFLEHALGSSDSVSDPDVLPTAAIASIDPGSGVVDEYLTLTIRRNLAADDVVYEVQVANDLASWSGATTLVSSTNNGDGTVSQVYRSNSPISASVREFIRLQVSAR